ncbi:MAG: FUSC family protein [Solirubrobacterales bacterium]|nr:FUSC family protein [Solirubrobacterales bacterium]
MIQRLLHIDRDKLDRRLAGYAVVGILLALAFEALIGVGALQAGIAAAIVTAVGGRGDLRTRLARMISVTLIGGAVGFLAYVSAETAWQAAVVLGAVAYLTGLAYGLGAEIGRAGYVLLLWALAVLIGEAQGGDPATTAAAFFVGGAAATVVVGAATVVRARTGGSDRPAAESADAAGAGAAGTSLGELVTSDLGVWSLLRALLTVVAVFVGYGLAPADLDPLWTAMALLIVFQPDLEQTLFKAAQRGLGTLAGAATAVATVDLVGSEDPIVAIVLVATFGAVAFYHANYLIYAFFITNAVLLYYWLATDHAVSTAGTRVLATVIGIGLAVGGMSLVALRGSRQRARRAGDEVSPAAP